MQKQVYRSYCAVCATSGSESIIQLAVCQDAWDSTYSAVVKATHVAFYTTLTQLVRPGTQCTPRRKTRQTQKGRAQWRVSFAWCCHLTLLSRILYVLSTNTMTRNNTKKAEIFLPSVCMFQTRKCRQLNSVRCTEFGMCSSCTTDVLHKAPNQLHLLSQKIIILEKAYLH